MSSQRIRGRSVISSKVCEVTISEGIITGVREAEGGAEVPWLSPGFFDIQVNGYKGINYSSDTLKGDDLLSMIEMLRESGTTRHLPTIITGPQERIIANLKILAQVLDENTELEYYVPGFHIEGPYISELDGPGEPMTRDISETLILRSSSSGRKLPEGELKS